MPHTQVVAHEEKLTTRVSPGRNQVLWHAAGNHILLLQNWQWSGLHYFWREGDVDTNLIEQVLINLTVNAIDAVKDAEQPRIILLASLAANNKMTVKVTDKERE